MITMQCKQRVVCPIYLHGKAVQQVRSCPCGKREPWAHASLQYCWQGWGNIWGSGQPIGVTFILITNFISGVGLLGTNIYVITT